jgi:uncharacterized membrane protein
MSRPARSRWLWPLLVASLSVNVLLASYVATLIWRLDMPIVEATNPMRVLQRASTFLAPEDRAAAERAVAEREAAIAGTEANVVAARAKLVALLQAPELDPAAIRATFDEVRSWRSRSFDLIVDAVIETLQTIPPERRRELMENFRAR